MAQPKLSDNIPPNLLPLNPSTNASTNAPTDAFAATRCDAQARCAIGYGEP